MNRIYVTLTYGMSLEVPEGATDKEIDNIIQGEIPSVSASDLLDYTWDEDA